MTNRMSYIAFDTMPIGSNVVVTYNNNNHNNKHHNQNHQWPPFLAFQRTKEGMTFQYRYPSFNHHPLLPVVVVAVVKDHIPIGNDDHDYYHKNHYYHNHNNHNY
jgi:hypothetical protein